MINLIVWLLVGALIGWLASMVMRTDAQQGALLNIVVGIVGAIIGGWIMSAFGGPGVTGFNIPSLLVSILGAVVLLFLVGLVRR